VKKILPFVSHQVPALRGAPFLAAHNPGATVLLTDRQRQQLTSIGMRLRLPARKLIYREGAPAQWIFAIDEGIVKSYREHANGKRTVAGFLFNRDLFGLAERGHYVNSTQAVTPVEVYRFPIDELTALLKRDGEMQFAFLVKVTHELRQSQRRAILVNRRDAAGRLAMFLTFMRNQLGPEATNGGRVPLPMTRSDIAGFVGLTLESVSRAAAELEHRGLVKFEGRSCARIVDPARLARLAAV